MPYASGAFPNNGGVVFRMSLIAVLLLLAHAGMSFGGDLRVVTESWPPYTYSENGEIKGVVTEIVEATLNRAGLDYSIELYPWARAYDIAKNNENVLIYSILKLPNREGLFKWIHLDGLRTAMCLFRPCHRTDITACTLEEARFYRIGVTRETSTHHFLQAKGFVEGANLFPVNCEEQNYLKSSPETNRIDFTTGDRLSLAHWLRDAGLPTDYWVAQVPLFQEDFYMAFGIRTPDGLVDRVRRALREMREEGEFAAIVDKYSRLYQ